jgi:hypothetical protein
MDVNRRLGLKLFTPLFTPKGFEQQKGLEHFCANPLNSLAERTGLEPATPGVTVLLSKSMLMRVSSQFVFQKKLKTCRFHAVLRSFIPKFFRMILVPDPSLETAV